MDTSRAVPSRAERRCPLCRHAADERRRIERDLHDGAQQRLVALALTLRSALRKLEPGTSPQLEQLLSTTADELQVAVRELRELAHGLHPGILTQAGLAHALDALAARMPLPVTVEATLEHLPPDAEATAYFVACEALANVAKHAKASTATVRVQHTDGTLLVEIEDDGAGGARPSAGTGLAGLADRLGSLAGRLRVESPHGAGTLVVGEIPCTE